MKKVLTLLLVLVAVCLWGCVDYPDITEEQEALMARYAAGTLLKHDKLYMEKLVTPTPTPEPTETPTPTPTSTPTPTGSVTEAPKPTGSGSDPGKGNETALAELKDVIGIDGIEITYEGYDVYENYTVDYTSIEPSSPNKMLTIIKIGVKNTTQYPVKLNLTDKDLNYRLYNDDTDKYLVPKWSILLNDFTTLDTMIEAGSTFDAVLLFETDKNFDARKLNLFIIKGDKTVIIVLK